MSCSVDRLALLNTCRALPAVVPTVRPFRTTRVRLCVTHLQYTFFLFWPRRTRSWRSRTTRRGERGWARRWWLGSTDETSGARKRVCSGQLVNDVSPSAGVPTSFQPTSLQLPSLSTGSKYSTLHRYPSAGAHSFARVSVQGWAYRLFLCLTGGSCATGPSLGFATGFWEGGQESPPSDEPLCAGYSDWDGVSV